MKKILFVTLVDLSGQAGNHIATREMVRAFVRSKDTQTIIICPSPKNELDSNTLSEADNVKYLSERPEPTPIAWHLIMQARFCWYLIWSILFNETDRVVSRMAPSLLIPALFSALFGIKYTLMIRGRILTDISNYILHKIAKFNIYLSIMICDKIIIPFEDIKEDIPLLTNHEGKLYIFNNAADPSSFEPVAKKGARENIGIFPSKANNSTIIGYVGSMADQHKLEILLESTQILNDYDINIILLLVGEGPKKKELQKLTRELGISNSVIFTGFIPHNKVSTYICACDIMYGVVDPHQPSNPIKCYEYLACNRPVITSAKREFLFVENQNFGVTLGELSPKNVSTAIRDFPENAIENCQEGNPRRYIVNNHTWDELANLAIR